MDRKLRILCSVLAIACVPLTSGADTVPSSSSGKVLVAKAASLNPEPFVPAPVEPVVEETVVHVSAPVSTEKTPQIGSDEAVSGSIGGKGRILAGNNCVECVRRMTGRAQNGNAGTWRPSSSQAWIGAIMIFRPGEQGASGAGHVGVVVGIRGNMIELAHCNWGGGQTVFYSTGKFW